MKKILNEKYQVLIVPEKIVSTMKYFLINKIQEKIDRFLSPYNKAWNMERWMNFDDLIDQEKTRNGEEVNIPEKSWNKISDLILNRKGEFLRKSLRILNKKKYQQYEEMSKTMEKMKPKRSIWRNQSYYRIQSIKNNEIAITRRNGITIPAQPRNSQEIRNSSKNLLRLPSTSFIPSKNDTEESPIDENVITRVVSIMKGKR